MIWNNCKGNRGNMKLLWDFFYFSAWHAMLQLHWKSLYKAHTYEYIFCNWLVAVPYYIKQITSWIRNIIFQTFFRTEQALFKTRWYDFGAITLIHAVPVCNKLSRFSGSHRATQTQVNQRPTRQNHATTTTPDVRRKQMLRSKRFATATRPIPQRYASNETTRVYQAADPTTFTLVNGTKHTHACTAIDT